ncbi:hypothetical protein FJU08_15205 [Martelella alba]|uniref:Uncharacterized protein n=1 Tax=Martelella alba TaxID=2590451 RepID=A0A506U899_9HYPH|nr:hypothetical protein [Martelella alba]TPW29195.1 hypothetical protein FJU08_15205 [Martelella alba]
MPGSRFETRIHMPPDLNALERGEPLRIPRPKRHQTARQRSAPSIEANASHNRRTASSSTVTVRPELNHVIHGESAEMPELTARYIKRFLTFHNARHELYEKELQATKETLNASVQGALAQLRAALPADHPSIQRLEKHFEAMKKGILKHNKMHQETVRSLARADGSFARDKPGCQARMKEFLTDVFGPLACSGGAWATIVCAILGNAGLGAAIQAAYAAADPAECNMAKPPSAPTTPASVPDETNCSTVGSEFLLEPTSNKQAYLADACINGFHGFTSFVTDVPRERRLELENIKTKAFGPEMSKTERFISTSKQSLLIYYFLAMAQSFIAFFAAKSIDPKDSDSQHFFSSLGVGLATGTLNAVIDGGREAGLANGSEATRQWARAGSRIIASKTIPQVIKGLVAGSSAANIALDVVFLGIGGSVREECVNMLVGKLQEHLAPSWTGEARALIEVVVALKAFLAESASEDLENGLDLGLSDGIARDEVSHAIARLQTELKAHLKELTHIYNLHDTTEDVTEGARQLSEKREYLKATQQDSASLSSLLSSIPAHTGGLFPWLTGHGGRSIHSEDLEDSIVCPGDIALAPATSGLRRRRTHHPV